MNKYHNGKIYKIVDNAYTKQYIGSTTESLSRRMSKHRHQYKLYQEGKKQKMNSADIFDEFGVENCKIELIEYCKCETKEELLKREGEHIKNCECVNRFIAGRTPAQFYQDNKERKCAESNAYYHAHKTEIAEKAKIYREKTKEQKRETDRLYREKNREQIKQKKNMKVVCECGATHTHCYTAQHKRSNKHQEYLKSLEQD